LFSTKHTPKNISNLDYLLIIKI